jgi:tRNA G26 N,N-dimethylase Trm1
MIAQWIEQNPTDADNHPRASQVKQKYGTLRFYMTHESEEMSKLINLAEQESETTCEVCGNSGKVREGGWIRTLCDHHVTSTRF